MTKPTNNIQRYGQQDIKILQKEPLYSGFFNMVKYAFKHKLYKGGWSEVIEREVFERGHAIAVLLYDPNLEEFVLIEQVRIGAVPTSESPWLIEVVAGIIDEGETAENVCRRESIEEAGVEVKQLTKALSYLSSPGGTTERLHIFVGEVDATQAQGVHGLDYEGEDILVHRVPEQQGLNWINEGKVDNAATLIALQWFAMNKQTLMETWSNE
ncbi:ADP-ribose diphosphatase [Paraglaciecola sp. L3A3]|uniref:ADP-ribose diphosphatase n=1 Tax=Paraglaciecola sp. L3A3 TaxID=2686358 RepID=UPI00131BACE9|nr:ADP-ribose diphosphatase [Paraglaciecola sp. L3A3]